MIFGFVAVIYIGHIPLVLLVTLLQIAMFREIVRLGSSVSRERKLKYFTYLQWYWFAVVVFFTYGSLLKQSFGVIIPWHSFVSFALYTIGFIVFVLSLRRSQYKYQFQMFGWCHLTLVLVVVQSSFLVSSMFEGLIWAVFPAMLIITNDMCAYQVGVIFGRSPLIQLSPNKTWEGFIGGGVSTIIFALVVSYYLSGFQLLVCPQTVITFAHPSCDPSSVFQFQDYTLPAAASLALSWFGMPLETVRLLPMQLHAFVLALFASVVAPFGGFFASGFKRAFKFKDFGNVIPGHGGVTDRMDCQIIMALFTYVYYWNFIRAHTIGAEDIFKLYLALEPSAQTQLRQLILRSGIL